MNTLKPTRIRSTRTATSHRWRDIFAIDPRSLASFRILAALVLLYDLAVRAADLSTMYGPGGLLPIDSVLAYSRASGFFLTWSLHTWSESLFWQGLLFGLAAAFAVALLFGYRTRLATILSWMLLVSLHARAPILVNGGDMLAAALLFWGIFLPLGGRWSLDVKAGRTQRVMQPVCSVASAAILLQMFIMYFCTGLSKFNEIWLTGAALENALVFDMFVRPLGRWLLEFPSLLKVLTLATLWGELLFPFLLFSPWARSYTRGLALVFFAGLHLSIEVTMTVALFSVISLAGLSLFLPSEFWRSRVVRGLRLKMRRTRSRSWSSRAPLQKPGWLTAWGRRPWTVIAAQGFCLVVLLFVVVLNASSAIWGQYEKQAFLVGIRKYRGDDAPSPRLPEPGKVEQWAYRLNQTLTPYAQALHFDQRWDMFSTPLDRDYRFVAPARLRNGAEIDVLRNAAVDLANPQQLPPAEPNVRWMLHYMGLTGPQFVWFAQDTAEYLRRQWNAAHPIDEQVETLSVVMVRHLPYAEGYEQLVIAEIGETPGTWILRHESGEKSAEGFLRDTVRQGHWTHWRADGAKSGEGSYRDGKREGEWTLWGGEDDDYERGVGKFYDDHLAGPWTYWHANGRKSAEGVYRDGKKEGHWISWYDNGQVNHEGDYHDGLEHGQFVFWTRDGAKEGEGAFVYGKEEGPWKIYGDNGIVTMKMYRDGEAVDFDLDFDAR